MTIKQKSIVNPPRWIKGRLLFEITGYSLDAQKHKRRDAVWVENLHWVKAPDGNILYNYTAIVEWVEGKSHG